MLVIRTGGIDPLGANVGYDHAHIAHINQRFFNQLHCCEKPVDKIRAFHKHLILPATEASGQKEFFRVLEIVVIYGGVGGVIANRGGDNIIPRQGKSVMHRNNAHLIIRTLDNDGRKAVPFL